MPNNLMPYIAQVADGQRPCLSVFRGDYPMEESTGVRDCIHFMSLAKGQTARRAGDVTACYANPKKAGERLNRRAVRGLEDMCDRAWHCQQSQPSGLTL